ncbi:MAG: trehalose-phosphatase [Isosphaeraceae bacterium]
MALLLDEHRSEVEARVAAASSLVFYLDFDGTLAPIVVEPELARMAPETRTVLEQLSRQEGILVCVVSGRSLADIKSRVGLTGLVYSGNHGLEIEGESLRFVHPEAGCGRAAIEDLNRRVAALPLLIPGVQLEPKGLSTTIHFRRADPTARDQIKTIVRSLVPVEHPDLMVTEGLMNYEIRPRLDWNKGSAVRWIHERIKDRAALVFVIGDDRTDEDAFPSLADAITVRVGPGDSTSARYYLPDQSDLGTLLGWLLELWKNRLDSADSSSQSHIGRPALALKKSSPILNVRLRRAAVDRRRQASR